MAEDGDGGILKRAHVEFEFDSEIISEILARLPVKSLMRFRCVSKSWSNLIYEPYFTKKHLRYSEMGITASTSRLLYSMYPPQSLDHEALKEFKDDSDGCFDSRKLDFPVQFSKISLCRIVIGCCNGLICNIVQENPRFDFMLWNPCTKYCKMIPKLSFPLCIVLTEGDLFCGIGYDSTSDDYKVVVGTGVCEEKTEIHLFSLRTGSWRVLPRMSLPKIMKISFRGIYLNGALHWSAENGREILCFDVEEEKFRDMIPLPDAGIDFHGLTVAKNCLCVFNHRVHRDLFSTIWLMKKYGVKQSWTEVIRCSRNDFPEGNRRVILNPICILESGVLLADDPRAKFLVLYDPVEKTFKNVTRRRNPYACKAFIYKETLVSPVTDNVADI